MGVLVSRERHVGSELLRTQLAQIRFFPRVDPFVLLQFRLILEAFPTVGASVWPLIRVTEHVDLQVSPPGTSLATLFTFKWFLPRMDHLMLLQGALPSELLPTHLAAVRFLSRVGEEVLTEGVQQVETLTALFACVTSLSRSLFRRFFTPVVFPVLCVDVHMQS